jgi:hypothetical protein
MRLKLFEVKFHLLLLVLLLCCTPAVIAQSDPEIQSRLDGLALGTSSLDQIKALFGEPASQKQVFEWWGGWRDGEFEGMYTLNTLEKKRADLENITKRTLYKLNYPKLGLVISVFDNPWRLHSVTIEAPNISVLGIKVGDPLKKVKMNLGEGEWSTSDKDDYWWLTYESRGVRFGFLRKLKASKYPIKLASKKIVLKIERFDNKVSFLDTASNNRMHATAHTAPLM